MPSDADIIFTDRICEAANLLDIQVLDHIIIGDGKYYSIMND